MRGRDAYVSTKVSLDGRDTVEGVVRDPTVRSSLC